MITLAGRAEQLGYYRFWVAEHHATPYFASAVPPALAARLAAATTTIRVGAGGVMLPNHTPLVVAEQFGTLGAPGPGTNRPGHWQRHGVGQPGVFRGTPRCGTVGLRGGLCPSGARKKWKEHAARFRTPREGAYDVC